MELILIIGVEIDVVLVLDWLLDLLLFLVLEMFGGIAHSIENKLYLPLDLNYTLPTHSLSQVYCQ